MARDRQERTSPGLGKVIDRWTYVVSGPTGVQPEVDDETEEQEERKPIVGEHKVEVRLHMPAKTLSCRQLPHETTGVEFVVVCDDPKFAFRGTDCEALRVQAWAALDARYQIKWEDWYRVSVDHSGPYEGMGTGLTFTYTRVEKGVAWDGTELIRYRRWAAREAIVEIWPETFIDAKGSVVAVIPASEENRLALEEFSKRIDVMRKMLADFLKPEVIMHTLRNLSGIACLPAIPENAGANGESEAHEA